MSVLSRHPAVRWTIPIAAVGIALGGTAVATQLSASADSTLPPRSAAQLLVDVQTARISAGSGTVVEKADLGLPSLPVAGGSGSSELSALLSGNHTLRVWYSGPSKVRAALLGTLGESDVIRNGSDLWFWSSDKNTATHRLLPTDGVGEKTPTVNDLGGLTGSTMTPQQAADRALAAVGTTTSVSTDPAARVAGRDAYELVLAPKGTGSLIKEVRIAVDAVQHVPLRVQVFARNASEPSAEVGFTQVSFTRPADSQFRFSPPPGAKITAASTPSATSSTADRARGKAGSAARNIAGSGWTSVVQEKLPATVDQLAAKDGQLAGVLQTLPKVSGSWGSGRLLSSNLFSLLLTDDGRVLAGAVPPDELYRVAGAGKP